MRKIPTLEDLQTGNIELSPLQKLLESEPPKEWLKDHPTALSQKNGEPIKYLSIERIDYLLRSIFKNFWWEVSNVGIYQNSVQVTGRLFYVNPETNKVQHSDGVGGSVSSVGMETAVPIAESNAKKSAAKKLGKIFGRDLSREIDGEKKEKKQVKKTAEKHANPVYQRIVSQIMRTKKKEVFQNIFKNISKKLDEKQISQKEFDEITVIFNKKIKSINEK